MLLKLKSSGSNVVTLQTRLNRYGQYGLKADGAFGKMTDSAVRDFQKREKLGIDGIVGNITWSRLMSVTEGSQTALTLDRFKSVFNNLSDEDATSWFDAFESAMTKYEINTPNRVAAFLANISHECNNFRNLEESLNYSATRLAQVWPNRYSATGKSNGSPNDLAVSIAGNPVLVASYTYANRMGNGGPDTKDGWNYRGRCPIMVTGRDNYRAASNEIGIDLVSNPDQALDPKVGALISAHFWYSNGINQYADQNDFDGCCDKVNIGRKTAAEGDAVGYAQRLAVYRKLLA